MSEIDDVVPVVGMGATMIMHSDRHPYTVTEVRNERTIVVQRDNEERTDANGMSECQSYVFSCNPSNPKIVVTKRKDGHWRIRGDSQLFAIGFRSRYHDYSF